MRLKSASPYCGKYTAINFKIHLYLKIEIVLGLLFHVIQLCLETGYKHWWWVKRTGAATGGKDVAAVDSTPTPPDSTNVHPNSTQFPLDSYSCRSATHRPENCCGKIAKGAGRTQIVLPQ